MPVQLGFTYSTNPALKLVQKDTSSTHKLADNATPPANPAKVPTPLNASPAHRPSSSTQANVQANAQWEPSLKKVSA
jgi:hypothetical protein